MSASYTDQEVIALIGRVLNHYHLSGEHFLFNRTATGLEVLTTPNHESWLLVSLLGWLQADFDLTFLDGAGRWGGPPRRFLRPPGPDVYHPFGGRRRN